MSTKRIALVTGGSRGIGESIVRNLANEGYSVVVNYASNELKANNIVDELNNSNCEAMAIKCDIANTDQVKQMFDFIEEKWGSIDVLVNNAGVMQLATLANADEAHFDNHIAVNLKGTLNTLHQAAKRLNNHGRIINLSTSVISLKLEGYGTYAATKAAIEAVTGILAKELRGRSITVNAVAPGPTATELFLSAKSDELIETMAKMPPLERLGTPADIANLVSFLVSDQGQWINGQVIRANGGLI
ncbi:SDR family oxidoreductase [Paraglaciecola sp. L3A3]|uniref:SDR family oxidoreductase n=1 Tax=Paraglaciecola sp. L3A3 TaxID=2686358 RepID=UPI0018EF2F35|nr:SDR family oxidoreductase [Paraglaciecola sp. L3A3]